LQTYLKCEHLKPFTEHDFARTGIPKGFVGPHQLDKKVRIIYDSNIDLNGAYVVGALEEGYHYNGFVPHRDATAYPKADLRLARAGDACSHCGGTVEEIRGIEVGHIFQLGDKYTRAMNASVLDPAGKQIFPLMGCYGIGITRIVAAAIEQNHDQYGIAWPTPIAPYHAYLAVVSKDSSFNKLGDEIAGELWAQGIETILDDRDSSPGFKFKDADLLGLPIRITLGERDFKAEGVLEVKFRKTGEIHKIKRGDLIPFVKDALARL
jgi:prolyl-tRNA synthetase